MKSIPECAECDLLEVIMADASRQFLLTGIIPDAMLQCFNQQGEWLGETAASPFVEPAALKKLRKVTIPESRRTITNECGESILLTSFMLEKADFVEDPVIVIPWHEIRGMCMINIVGNLSCPNLRRLNPHYSPVEMSALTIRLPVITEVDSITLLAEYISIPKLTHARYLHFSHVRHVDAPCLQIVDNLQLGSAFSAHFPQLREVSGPLVGNAIREFSAPFLESVNPKKTGHDGLLLPEAWAIDAPKLQMVGVRLNARTEETFCPLDLIVDGVWQMHHNAERIRTRLAMRGTDIPLEL